MFKAASFAIAAASLLAVLPGCCCPLVSTQKDKGPVVKDEPPSDGGEKDKGGNKPIVRNDLPVYTMPTSAWETKETLVFDPKTVYGTLVPGSLRVSPDGRRYAFAVKGTLTGQSGYWIVDGKKHTFDYDVDVKRFVFSADSKHYAL